MKRKLYLLAGAVLVLTTFPTLVVVPDLTPLDRLGTAFTGVGGLLFLAAALRETIPFGVDTVEWFQFAGGGDVCIGIGLPLSLAASNFRGATSTTDYVLVFAAGIAGLLLVFIGLDMIRGGEYTNVREATT